MYIYTILYIHYTILYYTIYTYIYTLRKRSPTTISTVTLKKII